MMVEKEAKEAASVEGVEEELERVKEDIVGQIEAKAEEPEQDFLASETEYGYEEEQPSPGETTQERVARTARNIERKNEALDALGRARRGEPSTPDLVSVREKSKGEGEMPYVIQANDSRPMVEKAFDYAADRLRGLFRRRRR